MIKLDKINIDDYYTVGELAERIGVKATTVKSWINRGTNRLNKSVIVGKKIYISGKTFADFWYDRMIAGKSTEINETPEQTPQPPIPDTQSQQQLPPLPYGPEELISTSSLPAEK